jgi:hypothetical protein
MAMIDNRISQSLCSATTVVLLFMSATLGAQTPAPIPLRPLFDQIRGWSPEHGALYMLTYRYHDHTPQTGDQVWSRIAEAKGRQPINPIEQASYAFVTGYYEALSQTFELMTSGRFVSTDPLIPLLVGAHRDQVAVVIEGRVYDQVFNTLRTTTHGRALDVARAVALPALHAAKPLCQLPAVGFVGLEVIYGSKNFLDHADDSLKAEVLTVVTPSATCRQFIAGAISEDELLRSADVYLQDRDSLETRKVTLAIQ